MSLIELENLLAVASDEERRAIFTLLRDRYELKIHPLETRWNTTAEAILDAIDQSADLTQRGIRGVLAEATFRTIVLPKQLTSWKSLPVVGDQPYDLLLDDGSGSSECRSSCSAEPAGRPNTTERRQTILSSRRSERAAGSDVTKKHPAPIGWTSLTCWQSAFTLQRIRGRRSSTARPRICSYDRQIRPCWP